MGLWDKCWTRREPSKQRTETSSIRLLLWIILCEQQRYLDEYISEAKCLFYTHDMV